MPRLPYTDKYGTFVPRKLNSLIVSIKAHEMESFRTRLEGLTATTGATIVVELDGLLSHIGIPVA